MVELLALNLSFFLRYPICSRDLEKSNAKTQMMDVECRQASIDRSELVGWLGDRVKKGSRRARKEGRKDGR